MNPNSFGGLRRHYVIEIGLFQSQNKSTGETHISLEYMSPMKVNQGLTFVPR